jgi:hypothetical protein
MPWHAGYARHSDLGIPACRLGCAWGLGYWHKLAWAWAWVKRKVKLNANTNHSLTLGLMGLDELHLRVLAASSSDETEKRNAKKVLALMQKGRHWVLVVLLLGNVVRFPLTPPALCPLAFGFLPMPMPTLMSLRIDRQ